MLFKTIYIILDDHRETGWGSGDGISGGICYSKKEACIALLKRVWYYEPEKRLWIKEMWKKYGPIKAWHDHVSSAWLYNPVYVTKRVKLSKLMPEKP